MCRFKFARKTKLRILSQEYFKTVVLDFRLLFGQIAFVLLKCNSVDKGLPQFSRERPGIKSVKTKNYVTLVTGLRLGSKDFFSIYEFIMEDF